MTSLPFRKRTTRYASAGPQAGYIDSAVVRRDLLSSGEWSNATFVTWTTDRPWNHTKTPPLAPEAVPSHTDGHIPFERVVPVVLNETVPALAMTATYLGVVADKCKGCPTSASSVVLVSTDGGHNVRAAVCCAMGTPRQAP